MSWNQGDDLPPRQKMWIELSILTFVLVMVGLGAWKLFEIYQYLAEHIQIAWLP